MNRKLSQIFTEKAAQNDVLSLADANHKRPEHFAQFYENIDQFHAAGVQNIYIESNNDLPLIIDLYKNEMAKPMNEEERAAFREQTKEVIAVLGAPSQMPAEGRQEYAQAFVDMMDKAQQLGMNIYTGRSPNNTFRENATIAQEIAELPGKTVVMFGFGHFSKSNDLDEMLAQLGKKTETIVMLPDANHHLQSQLKPLLHGQEGDVLEGINITNQNISGSLKDPTMLKTLDKLGL